MAPADMSGQVAINELVSSNQSGLEDEDGDRPDWIELYNSGTAAIGLVGYGLSDDPDDPFKWRLPHVIVSAKGFLVVFASGKDRTNAAKPMHTSFSIQAGGEKIVLTRPDGHVASELPSKGIPRDVSCGRKPDGSDNVFLFPTPTPRAANSGTGYRGTTGSPKFSQPGGFFRDPVSLSLSSKDDAATIRYTVDGSEPGLSSPVYSAPIEILDRNGAPNVLSLIPRTATVNEHTDGWFPPSGLVAKATVIRARAFRPGALPSSVITHTYFVGPNSPGRFGLPVISLVTDTNGLFNYVKGIYVLGKIFDDYVAANPNVTLTGHTAANYHGRGPGWERLAHLEYFHPGGAHEFDREVSIEINGQSSRSFRQKSFGIRTLDGDIHYDLFPGLRTTGTGDLLTSFNKLRLGNSGNDWAYTMLRDALCHRLVAGLPLDALAYRPAVMFLDGEFWGIHNIREQQDGTWIEAHYGVPRPDVVICETFGTLLEGRPEDAATIHQARKFALSHDLTIPANLAYIRDRIDIDNFLLYFAAEIYFGNGDWPHNNQRYWRKRTTGIQPDAPRGHDGRWRWLLFDTDVGYSHPWSGGYGANTLANAQASDILFQALLTVPEVRDQFVNRMSDLLNSSFRSDRATAVIDGMAADISPAIPEHVRRWRTFNGSAAGWSNNVRSLRLFASQRPINVRQHMITTLKLPGYAFLTVDVFPPKAGEVRVNTLLINATTPGVDPSEPYPWRGTYFRDVPIPLEAWPAPGWRFAGWDGVAGLPSTANINLPFGGPTKLTARFESVRPAWVLLETRPDGSLQGTFTGTPGERYRVESSEDFKNWSFDQDIEADANGVGLYRATPSSVTPERFLRLVVR